MYSIWVKIDKSLPWIELEGNYQSRQEAQKAAETFRSKIQTKVVTSPKREKLALAATIKA